MLPAGRHGADKANHARRCTDAPNLYGRFPPLASRPGASPTRNDLLTVREFRRARSTGPSATLAHPPTDSP
jgi:hypothetical protein